MWFRSICMMSSQKRFKIHLHMLPVTLSSVCITHIAATEASASQNIQATFYHTAPVFIFMCFVKMLIPKVLIRNSVHTQA